MATLYPQLSPFRDVEKTNPQVLYNELVQYTSELKFLLEQRDAQLAASPANKVYAVLDINTIPRPNPGDIAFSTSAQTMYVYRTPAGWTALH